ncbi:MAG: TOBE domain-containing protein, partial [Boseongicola sp. SB0667_bin_21]|nr:TOBE domain-containing protein [Boseongicola sp. SB0667_bin_21]
VSVVEPTGSETHVVARTEAEEIVAVLRERHSLSPGQPIFLSPDPDQIHLFDVETGYRLN